MNKSLLTAAACIALAHAAQAADQTPGQPYVGLDFVHVKADYESLLGVDGSDLLDDRINGVAPYVGWQFNKNLGVELGYLHTEEGKKSDVLGSGIGSKIRLRGVTLDVVGTLPVSADNRLALLGAAGIGRYEGKISASDGVDTISTDDSDVGYRLGAGAQYQFNEKWGTRAMLRYTKVDFDDSVNNLISGSVGLNYKF